MIWYRIPLLKAMRYSEQFKDGTNFRGWSCIRIMKNTLYKWLSEELLRQGSIISIHEEIPAAQLQTSATRLNVRRTNSSGKISTMQMKKHQPQEYLTPFVSSILKGLNIIEIAEMLCRFQSEL